MREPLIVQEIFPPFEMMIYQKRLISRQPINLLDFYALFVDQGFDLVCCDEYDGFLIIGEIIFSSYLSF